MRERGWGRDCVVSVLAQLPWGQVIWLPGYEHWLENLGRLTAICNFRSRECKALFTPSRAQLFPFSSHTLSLQVQDPSQVGGRGSLILEFKVILIYKVNFRTARATQRNPVMEKQNKTTKTKQNNKKTKQTNKKQEFSTCGSRPLWGSKEVSFTGAT